MLGTYSKL